MKPLLEFVVKHKIKQLSILDSDYSDIGNKPIEYKGCKITTQSSNKTKNDWSSLPKYKKSLIIKIIEKLLDIINKDTEAIKLLEFYNDSKPTFVIKQYDNGKKLPIGWLIIDNDCTKYEFQNWNMDFKSSDLKEILKWCKQNINKL